MRLVDIGFDAIDQLGDSRRCRRKILSDSKMVLLFERSATVRVDVE